MRGTESDVAGMISATSSMKTVRDSSTVIPAGGDTSTLASSPLPLPSSHEVCGWGLLTQRDLLPRVGRQQEDQQCQRGDEHAGHEEIEAVVERPPPHHHREGHVRVRLLAAVIEALVPLAGNLWMGGNLSSCHALIDL